MKDIIHVIHIFIKLIVLSPRIKLVGGKLKEQDI
jgi:hypothetical protein